MELSLRTLSFFWDGFFDNSYLMVRLLVGTFRISIVIFNILLDIKAVDVLILH